MMKQFKLFVASVMIITSPMSTVLAHASANPDCDAGCANDKDVATQYCFDFYFGQIDVRDMCLWDVAQEYQGCMDNCTAEYGSLQIDRDRLLRDRPVELGARAVAV